MGFGSEGGFWFTHQAWISSFLADEGNVKVTMTKVTTFYRRSGPLVVTGRNDGPSDRAHGLVLRRLYSHS